MVSWALALALAAPAATAPLDDEDERYEAQGVDGKEPLPRFGEVAPGVLRSGQPNRAGLGTLAERGVKTVLSLRRWVVRGEREETARLKMAHASVAMSGWKFPTFRQVDRALAVLTDPSRQPVLVHCAFGKDRTGTVVAAYRVVVEGVPVAAAAAEAYRYGCCSVSWAGSLERWLEGYRRHRGGGGGAAAQAEQQPEFRLPDPELPAELMFDGGAARGDVTPVLCERPPLPPALSPALRGRGRMRRVEPPGFRPLAVGEREALRRKALAVLDANRQEFHTARGVARYTAPDRERYPYQWLWDSAFHAIGLRHVDPERAADELRSLAAGQWDNGMIPNMVHVRPDILRKRHWRAAWDALRRGRLPSALGEAKAAAGRLAEVAWHAYVNNRQTASSGITQPPILAEAALAVAEKLEPEAGRGLLSELYPALRRYYDWIDRERVSDGLMTVYHSWETGTDNSPRFDAVYRQDPARYREWRYNLTKKLPAIRALRRTGWRFSEKFAVKSVDMNSHYHRNLRALARVARELGRDQEAAELDARADAVRRAVDERLWDPAHEGFRDLGLVGGRWKRLAPATALDFMPLYAGLLAPGDPRARALVGQLLDPSRFGGRFPVPSVSRRERSFDPTAYWRGTSWVNVNYFIVRGLLDHGYKAEARDLIERTLAMVGRGGMREYFNPDTGAGYRAEGLSWTAALTLELDRMLAELDAGLV